MTGALGPDDHFNRKLVLDVMVKVFSYLSTKEKLMVIPQVCKQWAVVVQNDSRLWTAMEVWDDIPVDTCVAQLIKSPSLKILKLGRIRQRCDDILEAVATHCPDLEELILGECTAKEETFESLVVSCTELKSCELIICEVSLGRGLLSVFSPCPHLQKLTLMLFSPSPTHAPGIPWNYPSLKELSVLKMSDDIKMQVLTRIGPQLEELHVDHLKERETWLLANCQRLQGLQMELACEVSNECLLGAVGMLTNLRDLKLQGCYRLTHEGLRHFLARKEVVGRLENLNLDGATISEACLRLIADNCPALRTLHINYNPGISLDFFRDFISGWLLMDPRRLMYVCSHGNKLPQHFVDWCKEKEGLKLCPPCVLVLSWTLRMMY